MYYNSFVHIIAGTIFKFELVNYREETYKSGELGLLLYNGGTVCDDGFDTNDANVICIQMGFAGVSSWQTFSSSIPGSWSFRDSYKITLDEINCVDGRGWDGCAYITNHDCSHHEDVFLYCQSENII